MSWTRFWNFLIIIWYSCNVIIGIHVYFSDILRKSAFYVTGEQDCEKKREVKIPDVRSSFKKLSRITEVIILN